MKLIAESLASIAADWPTLLEDARTIPAIGGGGGSPSRIAKLPGGTARLSLIAETRHTLWHWCRIVLEERAADTLLNYRVEADDVVAMCRWLRPHAEWIEAHYAWSQEGQEAGQEFAEIAGQIRALVEPSGIRRPPIGPCQIGDCGGTIRGYIDCSNVESADLACDVDAEHRWERDHWIELAGRLGHDYPETMTTEQLADYLAQRFRRPIRPDSLRKWTMRHGIGIWRGGDGLWDRVQVTKWYLGWADQKLDATA